jgi:hypothetical protein
MHLTSEQTLQQSVEHLFLAPLNYPEIVPTVLPLIVGAVIIELYFGKHPEEQLGWNTSVGNAVIWSVISLNLLITMDLSIIERQAVYGFMTAGAFVTYMDFYHRWPPAIAYTVSSAGIVYSLAYILVVMVKADLAFTETGLKAAAVFFIAVNMGFKLIQGFERPAQESFGMNGLSR